MTLKTPFALTGVSSNPSFSEPAIWSDDIVLKERLCIGDKVHPELVEMSRIECFEQCKDEFIYPSTTVIRSKFTFFDYLNCGLKGG